MFKSSTQIVKEIHNEIDSAQDRLLDEAKRIINSYSSIDKAERLEKIGFIASAAVVENKKRKDILVRSKEQADLIEYYKINYPLLKFITEGELDRICKKYRLIYMPIQNYIGDVPEKNLREIETAQKRKECDAPTDIIWCELKKEGAFKLTASDGGSWCGIWGKEWYRIPGKINGVHFRNQYEADDYLKKNLGFTTTYLVGSVKNVSQNRQGLFICAAKSKFIGQDKSISFIEVKDPIVFRYCKGGVQILSKWGLEAADELLVNEFCN